MGCSLSTTAFFLLSISTLLLASNSSVSVAANIGEACHAKIQSKLHISESGLQTFLKNIYYKGMLLINNKNEASELFGHPKDESFKGILGNIVQSFDGEYLYPSIEE